MAASGNDPADSLPKELRPLPDAHSGPDGEWVTLVRCNSVVEADAIVSRLNAAGIPTFLPDEHLMQAVSWNLNTYGFARVQVSPGNVASARQVLGSADAAPLDHGTADGERAIPRAAVPLGWPMRVFALAMPPLVCVGLLLFAVARGGYLNHGYDRKAKELLKWYAAGVVIWGIAFVVLQASMGGQGSAVR